MQDVASLAECREVSIRVVGRVVVSMRGRQHHPRHLHQSSCHILGNGKGSAYPAASAVPPPPRLGVPPSAVAEVLHVLQMRPAAPLAAAIRSHEADDGRKLLPVDWVEITMLATDRHQGAASWVGTAFARLAIRARVERLQPVAAWIWLQGEPAFSMAAIPSFRFVSS